MSYTALYRRFRPDHFGGLVGQAHISRTLANAVKKESFMHAYLFCGPRGTGKTSTAKILAKAINCLDPQEGEPCGICPACQRLAKGESLDVLEIDAASNRGIDEIRDLRERVKYAPAQEKYKVYIIDEVHMLTGEAFNALLKTLEEPPAHVVFILATTEPHKIPLTVLSRCQRFDFRRIPTVDIAAHLAGIAQQERIEVTPEALALIARKSEGGLRDAVNLLDQCAGFTGETVDEGVVSNVLGAVDQDFIRQVVQQLLAGDLGPVLEAVEELVASGRDFRQFIYDLLEHLRGLLVTALAAGAGAEPQPGRILQAIQALGEADSRLRYSLQPRITLELGLIQACGVTPAPVPPASMPVPAETPRRAATPPPETELPPAADPVLPKGGGKKRSQKAAEGTPSVIFTEDASLLASLPPEEEIPGETAVMPAEDGAIFDPDMMEPPPAEEPTAGLGPIMPTEVPPLEVRPTLTPEPAKSKGRAKKAAAAEPAVEEGKTELERIQFLWPQLLQAVAKADENGTRFFLDCLPVALEGNRLVLGFPAGFEIYMETICNKPLHRHLVEEKIKQVYGQAWTISGRMLPPPPEGVEEQGTRF